MSLVVAVDGFVAAAVVTVGADVVVVECVALAVVASAAAACIHFAVVVAAAASSSGVAGGIAASVADSFPQVVGDIQIGLPFSLLAVAGFWEPYCPRQSLIRRSISWPLWKRLSLVSLAEERQSPA